jgi:hypothetical protein
VRTSERLIDIAVRANVEVPASMREKTYENHEIRQKVHYASAGESVQPNRKTDVLRGNTPNSSYSKRKIVSCISRGKQVGAQLLATFADRGKYLERKLRNFADGLFQIEEPPEWSN